MKKALFILFVIFITIPSCRKESDLNIKPLDLGKQSTGFKFNAPAINSNNNVITNISVTVGAKYSVQIIDISGDVVASKGVVADSETEIVTLDTKDVKPGVYDVIVIDTHGKEIKQPINIK